MSAFIRKLVCLISTALNSRSERRRAIVEFQRLVWERPGEFLDGNVKKIFSELAHDLDYYEADDIARREDPSYYGDDRLEQELKAGLEKLRAAGLEISAE